MSVCTCVSDAASAGVLRGQCGSTDGARWSEGRCQCSGEDVCLFVCIVVVRSVLLCSKEILLEIGSFVVNNIFVNGFKEEDLTPEIIFTQIIRVPKIIFQMFASFC